MNLNMNPKTLHFWTTIAQFAGFGATIMSLPGLTAVSPWIGIVGAGLATASTFVKGRIIGDIPPRS